jgi:N-methylhydantoinase A
VEFTTWKVRAIGDIGARRRLARRLEPQAGAVPVVRERAVYLGGQDVSLPVYDGSRIGAGARIEGPALIEETTTTLLVLERQTATTDEYGNYHAEVRS